MEVFKYVTESHYKQIKSNGRLDPRPEDGFIYGLPEDPNAWGPEHTKEILGHLQKYSGVSPIVLLKFVINNSDPDVFVQEGDEDVWFKMDTRKPINEYQREHFRLPEVVITRPIPFEEISIIV